MLRKPQPHPAKSGKPIQGPPCDCVKDPVGGLKKLFVDYAQGGALERGRDPATRPVFLRLHGAAHGTFKVAEGLPTDLRVGVFGRKAEYPVWVRLSGDIQPGAPDLKGTAGIAIKLFGVDGKKLLAPDEDALTHDFLLQNHDVFFVDTAQDMCEFTCQSLAGKFDEYVKAHPTTGKILTDMEKVVDSVLTTPYWSGLPYRFGKDRYVKYKLEPESAPAGGGKPDYDDPFYLRADLHQRLKAGEVRFRFMIQLRTDDAVMPLDRATVQWSESVSKPIHIATLVLPQQDLDTRGQSTYGENLAFNPWHALADHQPEGSIADARKVVYQASADVRRNFNGVPLAEPVGPRPYEWTPGTPYPPGTDEMIVSAKIHPAIGIARVGGSDEWFPGPDVTEPTPAAPNFYRDAFGKLKRQAATFRVYGYNARGQVVRELTAATAAIHWTVHVANRKAAWYQWAMALDIPEAATLSLPRRNADVKGSDRVGLTIDGQERSIKGTNTSGSEYVFRGKFMKTGVYLGELQTDEAGRLRFLGGKGKSDSPDDKPIYPSGPNGFINADGWYDDVSDGPVTAEVNIEGRQIPVEGAWVVTAPPDYGPGIKGIRTLYDLLFDLFVRQGCLTFPATISFRRHIYPILLRLSRLQWANKGFAAQFGAGGVNNFEDKDYVAKLAAKPRPGAFDAYRELRRQVFNSFRDPDGADNNPLPWPWLYGDAGGGGSGPTPRENATISPTQYNYLRLWAAGQFEADWPGDEDPHHIVDVPERDQPEMLDRAALEFCLADAFHPGCEVTWPIRHLTMFSKPFRILRASSLTAQDYGKELTQAKAVAPAGPLHAQGPGDLTRWMGLPWQADTAFCQSGYSPEYDPYLPTFWPGRVPNYVLTRKNYNVVIDNSKSWETRFAAFSDRMRWNDALTGTNSGQMRQMVQIFDQMGLLEVQDGVTGTPGLPEKMLVATFGPDVDVPEPPAEKKPGGAAAAPQVPTSPQHVLHKHCLQEAGWASDDEREEAPFPIHHPRRQ